MKERGNYFCWFLLRLGILIISFIFVTIIEEKFLMINFSLKSLIICRARISSYFIDNSTGILLNMCHKVL